MKGKRFRYFSFSSCSCTEGSVVEEYISDGELTDLLADVDEMPSTSSRLRPSTMNQPSSSTGPRRHSQRIQSRASSSSPNPRPQTSWVSPALNYSTVCLSCVYRKDGKHDMIRFVIFCDTHLVHVSALWFSTTMVSTWQYKIIQDNTSALWLLTRNCVIYWLLFSLKQHFYIRPFRSRRV